MINYYISHGAHIIDSACGAGKTSDIFSFICQHYDEGILYCVDSIAELHKMYDRLKATLVPIHISADDIMMITSERSAEAEYIRHIYHNDPNILLTKKILLITHVRFFSSMINYFVIYNQKVPIFPFDGNFNTLLTRPDLRQWIFFDETPLWIRPFCTMPKCFLGIFSEDVNGVSQCKPIDGLLKGYNDYIKYTQQDPFHHYTRLDALEEESVLSMIPTMYPTWISEERTKNLDIIFRPRNLVVPQMQTHVLVFEGAADLLLRNSPFIFSPSNGRKYNADVHFYKIPFEVKRGADFNNNINKYMASLQVVSEIILRNIDHGKKTLVCLWKSSSTKEDSEETNSSQFRDMIKDKLLQDVTSHNYNPQMFDVIYYGENKCKSSNDYKDFAAIILLGKWRIPSDKYIEHNLNWGTNISYIEFNMWFFVQLICRIGIRNHNGGLFDVYLSEDFDDSFINDLDNYFNRGVLPNPAPKSIQDMLTGRLKSLGIKRDNVGYINSLCSLIPGLQEHILNEGNTNTLDIQLSRDQLKTIIPTENGNFARSRKRLVEALRKVNVRWV